MLAPATALLNGAVAPVAILEQVRFRPPLLRAFLQAMPKGGDLHLHLSGGVYAERLVDWAVKDGLCIDTTTDKLQACPTLPFWRGPVRRLVDVVASETAFRRVVDAWSMRYHASESGPGHDQFFSTFAKFRAVTSRRTADLLAEVAGDAANQNVGYLEIMLTVDDPAPPPVDFTIATGADLPASLEAAAKRLATVDLNDRVERALASLANKVEEAGWLRGCPATEPYRICDVEVRFIQQIYRNQPAESVFRAMFWAFALAAADGPVVGVNMVGAEDWRPARTDYRLHMQMLKFLTQRPGGSGVQIALHAGEQTLGLVPPTDLRSHLWDAVEIGGARRLGHAVSLGYEQQVFDLLARLRDQSVPIEITLSSDDVILGVEGAEHPFQVYHDYGVPLVISTDDPGILRSDLTHEYQRVVETYGLGYADLKQLARNAMSFAFVQGASLWLDPRSAVPVEACRDARSGTTPNEDCREFLAANPKARLQWDLENRFAAFEAGTSAPSSKGCVIQTRPFARIQGARDP